tara:strand:- start:31 stop:381 length:351 start_codon:yes stop_codon:yes gene_type:complete
MIDRSTLIKELKEKFPDLRADINQEQGMLHFEVAVFYKYTQSQINIGEVDTVKLCFSVAENFLLNGNTAVKNAISTSFAECLDFNNTNKHSRVWAWDIYPETLKKEYLVVRGELGI